MKLIDLFSNRLKREREREKKRPSFVIGAWTEHRQPLRDALPSCFGTQQTTVLGQHVPLIASRAARQILGTFSENPTILCHATYESILLYYILQRVYIIIIIIKTNAYLVCKTIYREIIILSQTQLTLLNGEFERFLAHASSRQVN